MHRIIAAAAVLLAAVALSACGGSSSSDGGAVVGVPGVVGAESGTIRLTHIDALEGRRLGDELADRLGVPVTLENDINLAAVGEHAQGVARGVDDFAFLSVGTGLGAGLVLRGELHRGRHGAAGEVDYVSAGLGIDIDPSAERVAALAAERGVAGSTRDVRSVFAAARMGDEGARGVAEEVARRIALHVTPIAAVTDVELVVLGGGLGANADLLLAPVRSMLAGWLPYPPRVEVSSLGDAAVLAGALAVGLRSALESVFPREPST